MVSAHLSYLGYPDYTAIFLSKEKVQVTTTHNPNPDETEIYFAAWLGCPSTRSNHIRCDRSGGEYGTQELTSCNIHKIMMTRELDGHKPPESSRFMPVDNII
jgi:hypothetical protein